LLELEHLGSDLKVAVVLEHRHPALSRQDGGPQTGDDYCSMVAGRAGARWTSNVAASDSSVGK
jgi:hypothetical protein